jgi:hypothetical protein
VGAGAGVRAGAGEGAGARAGEGRERGCGGASLRSRCSADNVAGRRIVRLRRSGFPLLPEWSVGQGEARLTALRAVSLDSTCALRRRRGSPSARRPRGPATERGTLAGLNRVIGGLLRLAR